MIHQIKEEYLECERIRNFDNLGFCKEGKGTVEEKKSKFPKVLKFF